MKQKNITVKIFLGTAFCFLLSYICAIAGGLTKDKDSYPVALSKKYGHQTQESQTYVELKRSFPIKDMTEIDVTTVSKDVQFNITDGDTIEVIYKGHSSPLGFNADKDFQTTADGGTLKIKTDERNKNHSLWNLTINNDDDGTIIVNMPKQMSQLMLHTVSADITVSEANLKYFKAETVSGDIDLNHSTIERADIATVSGNVESDGAVNVIDGKTISGDINLDVENDSPKIDIQTTSGDMKIAFKKQPDAAFSFSSISGSINVDQTFGGLTSEGKKAKFILGKGIGTVSAHSVSGDLTVAKW
jgi:hypothetical protein